MEYKNIKKTEAETEGIIHFASIYFSPPKMNTTSGANSIVSIHNKATTKNKGPVFFFIESNSLVWIRL